MLTLSELEKQLAAYKIQQMQTQQAYQQLCGAIHILETQIKSLSELFF